MICMKEGRHNRAHRSVYVRMTWFAHCNGGGTCLYGRLKIWFFKWEENEVKFFKCEEMK